MSVDALSETNAWAVGDVLKIDQQGGHDKTLVAHWDGTRWRRVPSPNGHLGAGDLNAVAAVTRNDVWAVGTQPAGDMDVGRTLIEHWDGRAWRIVPSPNGTTVGNDAVNELEDVEARSARDVWAVGRWERPGIWARSLILHWDGTRWKLVRSSRPKSDSAALYAVATTSSGTVWATGDGFSKRWNGRRWIYRRDLEGFEGYALEAISTNDIWAAGEANGPSHVGPGPLPSGAGPALWHWDGQHWAQMWVLAPRPDTSGEGFRALAATAPNDVWAVGNSGDSGVREHWDGSTWEAVPGPGGVSILFEVSAVSADDVWAVGYDIEHYSCA